MFFFEKVPTTANQICRIVVHISLRRIIFSLLHAFPAVGHMREYKTVYRIRLRFFWPKMRSDIHQWIKQCSHGQLTFRWRRRDQELMFSWPVSLPFAIIHVDL